MKIAIAGKGGVGKTTISGTLCRILAARGKKVLAIDGDPNPNLSTVLGIKPGESAAKALSTDILERVEDDEGNRSIIVREPLTEILEHYGEAAPDGIRLLMVGKPEIAGSGCMCGSHTTVREVIHTALESEEDHIVILDMEASMEHMKRGTAKYVDKMIVIVEPYYRSLEAAQRFAALGRDLEINEIFAIANKVRSEQEEEAIRQFCDKHDLEVRLIVPYDEQVKDADLVGESLYDHLPDSELITKLRSFAETL